MVAQTSEITPLLGPLEKLDDSGPSRWIVFRATALGSTTILLSVSLISFNQDLMRPGRFPYAVLLALMHMGFCSVMAGLLRSAAPSLFPALNSPEERKEITSAFLWRGALPIGVASVTNLVCTNLAFRHLSVAFLQMLKEGNIVLVYIFALCLGLERFDWGHIKVILFALVAAALAVHGELHFSASGFGIQMLAQVCESWRIVLMGALLSGRRLDALSCVLIVSPVCFALLASLSLLILALPAGVVGPSLAMPALAEIHKFAPLLLANCSMAFALNISIALTIKYTSAVSYLFMGVLKDVIAVGVSVLVLRQSISRLQSIAFCMQVCAVVAWSALKFHPSPLQEGCLVGETLPPNCPKGDRRARC